MKRLILALVVVSLLADVASAAVLKWRPVRRPAVCRGGGCG